MRIIILVSSLVIFCTAVADGIPPYSRDAFNYSLNSMSKPGNKGFYSGKNCITEWDHVVSLKDAWESGAHRWFDTQREAFANSKINLISACISINRSKGDSTPSDFLRKSKDGKGNDYEIRNWCGYIARYYVVKRMFELSFDINDLSVIHSCGIQDRVIGPPLLRALIGQINEPSFQSQDYGKLLYSEWIDIEINKQSTALFKRDLAKYRIEQINLDAHLLCESHLPNDSSDKRNSFTKYWYCYHRERDQMKPKEFYFSKPLKNKADKVVVPAEITLSPDPLYKCDEIKNDQKKWDCLVDYAKALMKQPSAESLYLKRIESNSK